MPLIALDDDPPKKKGKQRQDLKSKAKSTEKKPKKKRKPSARDVASRRLGEAVGKAIKLDEKLPEFEATEGIKKTGTLSLRNDETVKEEEQFGNAFRGLGPAMDEFVSTASMREFVGGLIGSKKWSEYSEAEQAYFDRLVDILSAIRAPTRYVGFTLDTKKVQHPTSRPEAIWEDPYLTTSAHSKLDQARRDYVQRAADAALLRGEGARGIVFAVGKAAIEFTLNNFMAPVSASNIQAHSRMAKLALNDPAVLKALGWREYLKKFYVNVLGGKLRTLDKIESKGASRKREWNPQSDFTQFAPPSPARDIEEGEIEEDEEKKATKEEMKEETEAPKIELGSSDEAPPKSQDEVLEESGLNILGQSLTTPSQQSPSDEIELDEYGSIIATSHLDLSDFLNSDDPGPMESTSSTLDLLQDEALGVGSFAQDQYASLGQGGQSGTGPSASEQLGASLTEMAMDEEVVEESALAFA